MQKFQTITGAMSTLSPPVALEKPENQARVDYIQDYASGRFFSTFPISTIRYRMYSQLFRPWFQLSTRVLWAYRRAVERSRCSTDIWKIKWIPTHRLRKIVSDFIFSTNGKWKFETFHLYVFSFLDRVSVIKQPNYTPSEQDILRCRVLTSGIFETRFQVDKVNFQ